MNEHKQRIAAAAVALIPEGITIGIGSGRTVNHFIEALSDKTHLIEGAVCASEETARRVKALNIPIVSLNAVSELPYYFDSADEINPNKQMIKGGGGAHTREKIIASVAKVFICMIEPAKQVSALGRHPIPVEVLPMARSYVGRQLYRLGASVLYREGFVSDEGNCILDVSNLKLEEPIQLEASLNQLPGLVGHGLFATCIATKVLVSDQEGVHIL